MQTYFDVSGLPSTHYDIAVTAGQKLQVLMRMIDNPSLGYSDAMLYYYSGSMVFDLIRDDVLSTRSKIPLRMLNSFLSYFSNVVDNGPSDFSFDDVDDDEMNIVKSFSDIGAVHNELKSYDNNFTDLSELDAQRLKAKIIYDIKVKKFNELNGIVSSISPSVFVPVEPRETTDKIVETIVETVEEKREFIENYADDLSDTRKIVYVTENNFEVAKFVAEKSTQFSVISDNYLELGSDRKFIASVDDVYGIMYDYPNDFTYIYDYLITTKMNNIGLPYRGKAIKFIYGDHYVEHSIGENSSFVIADVTKGVGTIGEFIALIETLKYNRQDQIVPISFRVAEEVVKYAKQISIPNNLYRNILYSSRYRVIRDNRDKFELVDKDSRSLTERNAKDTYTHHRPYNILRNRRKFYRFEDDIKLTEDLSIYLNKFFSRKT